MNSGQACRPCRGSCSPISGRGCFGDLTGDEIVVSPPSPIVEPLASQNSDTGIPNTYPTIRKRKPILASCPGSDLLVYPQFGVLPFYGHLNGLMVQPYASEVIFRPISFLNRSYKYTNIYGSEYSLSHAVEQMNSATAAIVT